MQVSQQKKDKKEPLSIRSQVERIAEDFAFALIFQKYAERIRTESDRFALWSFNTAISTSDRSSLIYCIRGLPKEAGLITEHLHTISYRLRQSRVDPGPLKFIAKSR